MTSGSLSSIESLVETTFSNALKSGDVIFEEGKTVEQLIDGCSYQVRYLPSLGKKPEKGSVKSDKDPLAPPYKKTIHVCDLPSYGFKTTTYAVILNKYAATKNHFLLVPQEFEKQSNPLSADDLSLIYQIIRSHDKKKVVAFFNCGEESGASQEHKHIQFFPVSENEPPIDVYLQDQNKYDQPSQLSQVPWAHFLISIHPPEQSDKLGTYLMDKFMQLLDKMFNFKQGKDFSGAQASYNVLIMKNYIHVIPRSRETFELANGTKLSVGGINYAGIKNVKQEEDLDEVKKAGVTNILLSVGLNKDE